MATLPLTTGLWALQKLGEQLPTGVQEFATSYGDEALAALQQTPLAQAAAYTAGASPEQVAERNRRAAETAEAARKVRSQTGLGRAASVLTGGTVAVTPPSKPTPEPTTIGASPAETKRPETRRVTKMVTDPASGRQVFIQEEVPVANDEAGYQAAVGRSAAANLRDAAAAMQAGRDMSTRSDVSGVVNPRGFSSRAGTEGTYSYMGTQGFDPEREYAEKDFRKLRPQEQREVLEREQATAQLRATRLGAREAEASVRMREAAAEAAADPIGFHNRMEAQVRQQAEQDLAVPDSPASIQLRAGLNEYRMKYPNATPEQLAEYEVLVREHVIRGAMDRALSFLPPEVRYQIAVAQARGGLFGMMPGATQ